MSAHICVGSFAHGHTRATFVARWLHLAICLFEFLSVQTCVTENLCKSFPSKNTCILLAQNHPLIVHLPLR
jgi:hypothetical protein